MPWLDVTEVLLDPYFNASLQVIHNANVTGDNGIAVLTQTTENFSGVVTTMDGSVLYRLPDGERSNTQICIHTKFYLSDGHSGTTADVVVWKGSQWTVKYVNNDSHYGAGFMQVAVEIIPLEGDNA